MLILGGLLMMLSSFILGLFFLIGKSQKWDSLTFQSFECGFSSYFFSRFSYSVHYFMVALIFLFLDLEICVLLPLFSEASGSVDLFNLMYLILGLLLAGLVLEWKMGKIEWMT